MNNDPAGAGRESTHESGDAPGRKRVFCRTSD